MAELAAVLIPATIAAGAWASVWLQGSVNVAQHIKSVYVATESLANQGAETAGQMMGLGHALQTAQNAANPQVYQALGAAIKIVNENSGTFVKTGLEMGATFDTFAAKMVWDFSAAGGAGKTLNNVLASMSSDLTEVGQVFGNLGRALIVLAAQMPGLAEVLLKLLADFLGGVAAVAELADKFTVFGVSILTAAMAVEEFMRWGGLLVTMLGKMGIATTALGDSFLSFTRFKGVFLSLFNAVPNIGAAVIGVFGRMSGAIGDLGTAIQVKLGGAPGILDAISGKMESAGDAGEKGMMGLKGAILSATGGVTLLQAASVTLALVGLGILIDKMVTAQSAAQKFAATLEDAVSNASNLQALTVIGAAMGQLQGKIQAANAALVTVNKSSVLTAGNTGMMNVQLSKAAAAFGATGQASAGIPGLFSRIVSYVDPVHYLADAWNKVAGNSVLATQNTVVLTAAQQKLAGQAANVLSGSQLLAAEYHTTIPGAMALATAAGVNLTKNITGQGEAATIARDKIADLAQGYMSMSAPAGAIGNDMTAVAVQTGLAGTQVSKLNSAWDDFMDDLTSGTTGLASFITGMSNMTTGIASATDNLSKGSGLTVSVGQFATLMKGTSKDSAQAWQNFNQVVGSTAPQLIDWLRTAGAEGAVSGASFTQAVRDMIAPLLPFAKDSSAASAELGGLVQMAGGPAITSYKQLAAWTDTAKTSTRGLGDIVDATTIKMGNMSQIAANLGTVLSTQLTSMMDNARLASSGVQGAINAYTKDLQDNTTQTAAGQAARAGLYGDLMTIFHNSKTANQWIAAMTATVTGNTTAATSGHAARAQVGADFTAITTAIAAMPFVPLDVTASMTTLARDVQTVGVNSGKTHTAWATLVNNLIAGGMTKPQALVFAQNFLTTVNAIPKTKNVKLTVSSTGVVTVAAKIAPIAPTLALAIAEVNRRNSAAGLVVPVKIDTAGLGAAEAEAQSRAAPLAIPWKIGKGPDTAGYAAAEAEIQARGSSAGLHVPVKATVNASDFARDFSKQVGADVTSLSKDPKVIAGYEVEGKYIGEGIVAGIAVGMGDGKSKAAIGAGVTQTQSVTVTEFEARFGMKSPATTMIPLGENIILGLVAGLAAKLSSIGIWVAALPGHFLSWMANSGTWLITSGGKIITGLVTGLGDDVVKVEGWFTALPGKIGGWLSALPGTMLNIGKGIITSIVAGIKAAPGAIATAIEGLIPGGKTAANVLSHIPGLGFLAGHAAGTAGAMPGWAVVGEEGPELIRMTGGEQVIPHGLSAALTHGFAGYAAGTGADAAATVAGVAVNPGAITAATTAATQYATAVGTGTHATTAGAVATGLYSSAMVKMSQDTATGHNARQQLIDDLASTVTGSGAAGAQLVTYTATVTKSAAAAMAAKTARQQLITDLTGSGTSASAANALVGTYTTGVTKSGTAAAGQSGSRAQLITDLKQSGTNAYTSMGQVGGYATALSKIPTVKTETLTLSGKGTWSVSEAAVKAAAGMLVTGGVRGKDSVLAALMPGELVVPEPMVSAGAADHLRGAIPGFAAGGYVGTAPGLGAYAGTQSAAVSTSMIGAMKTAMAAGANSASVAASASQYGGSLTNSLGSYPADFRMIMSYLIGHGFTKIGAAGVVGNIQAESGGNVEAIEAGGGGGEGLIQWTGHGTFVTGNYTADLAKQLAGILTFGGGARAVNAAESPAQAAADYMVNVERPANLSTMGMREASANAAYKAYAAGTGGAAPGWGVVGEEGAELVRFSGGETVVPHGLTAALGSLPGYAAGTDGASHLAELGKLLMGAPHKGVINAEVASAASAAANDATVLKIPGLPAATKATLTAAHAANLKRLAYYKAESSELTAYRTQLANENTALRAQISATANLHLAGLTKTLTPQLTHQVQIVRDINTWLGPTAAQAAAVATAKTAAATAASTTAVAGPSGQDLITAWLTSQGWDVGGTQGTTSAPPPMQWFDTGGRLPTGFSLSGNATGASERVLSHGEEDALSRHLGGGGSKVEALLGQVVKLLTDAPAKTAAGIGGALNGTARGAARKSQYVTR